MKKILITPKSFQIYKKEISRKYKNFVFSFLNGPINNKYLLSKKLIGKDGLIVGSEKIDNFILNKQKNLKVISRFGTNLDNIDENQCKKKKLNL